MHNKCMGLYGNLAKQITIQYTRLIRDVLSAFCNLMPTIFKQAINQLVNRAIVMIQNNKRCTSTYKGLVHYSLIHRFILAK